MKEMVDAVFNVEVILILNMTISFLFLRAALMVSIIFRFCALNATEQKELNYNPKILWEQILIYPHNINKTVQMSR